MNELAAAGILVRSDRLGEHRAQCPQPECAGKRSEALAVRVDADGAATWLCHRCGWKGGTRPNGDRETSARPTHRVRPTPAAPQRPAIDPAKPRRLFDRCRPIDPGTIAADYLQARGCALPHPGGDLRWHPEWRHPSGYTGPALVGLMTSATDAAHVMTLHQTWIAADGTKAPIDRPRLWLAGYPKAGGCIRLWPDDCCDLRLAIGEGVETCLALARLGWWPAWACGDAGNLEVFPVLDGIEALTVAVDRDRSGRGQSAALTCARRWEAAGRHVRLVLPNEIGTDVADAAEAPR